MIDEQINTGPKTEGEVGVTDRGGNKMYGNWPKERNLKHSQLRFGAKRKIREPTDGVDSLKTHAQLSRGELQPPYRVSHLTDCSRLRENITGAPYSF